MHDLGPIITAPLFPILDAKLIELLRRLSAEDWTRKALPQWNVKDVAAHLLDSNVRRLSIGRDAHWGVPFSGNTRDELNSFLNGLNHNWVEACRRLSPRVLIDLLSETGRQLSDYLQSVDPFGPAIFGVSWAGEEQSLNWFDIAREFTEKWHHQQQIRDAVGRQEIMTPELYGPVIATFVRVLPFTYKDVAATDGSVVEFQVTGPCGGTWRMIRNNSEWRFVSRAERLADASVIIPGELAWKLFTKGLSREAASRAIQINGNRTLGEPIFNATAIVG